MITPNRLRAVPDAEGVLQLDNLSALPAIRHGFATRRGRLEDVVAVPIARLQQVHAAEVLVLPGDDTERRPFFEPRFSDRPAADALVAASSGVGLAVSVADCLPLLIADPATGAIGAVHAGWRGLAGGVIENAVGALASHYGSEPVDLVVGIGPAIGPCCFEVGDEVIAAFEARGFGDEIRVDGPPTPRPYADLGAVAHAVLGRLGVEPDNVADAALCTKCHSDWLWSYRQDGELAGRMSCGIAALPVDDR